MTASIPIKVEFERILVPIDFTDISQKAIDYARCIARLYDSKITLAHVNRPANPVTPPKVVWLDQLSVQHPAERQLESLGAELRSQGFSATALSLTGVTHDEILGASQRENTDLIVLGTHGRTGVSRVLFGSDAEALYRHAACPILVVGPESGPAPVFEEFPSWHPRNILFASDLDPDTIPVAAFACQLAQEHQAAFTILHVDASEGKVDKHAHLNQFHRTFAEFLPAMPTPDLTWRTLMLGYGLGSTIADFAVERNSDLIVMGAHSAFPAASHFSRGIAPQVLAKAPCPVMILHKPY